MATKTQEYIALVAERKACSACNGLANPSQFAAFDSTEIGPWTRLHGDLNAQVMVVGQDWGDVKYFEANRGLDDLANPTMQALQGLFASAGIDAALDDYSTHAKGLFLTNAILCLKTGGLQATVQKTWFANCGRRFLRRQVEIVRPRVVVTLGTYAYATLCMAFGLRSLPLREAVSRAPFLLMEDVQVIPVYHCGRRVQNSHRALESQRKDWQRVRMALADRSGR